MTMSRILASCSEFRHRGPRVLRCRSFGHAPSFCEVFTAYNSAHRSSTHAFASPSRPRRNLPMAGEHRFEAPHLFGAPPVRAACARPPRLRWGAKASPPARCDTTSVEAGEARWKLLDLARAPSRASLTDNRGSNPRIEARRFKNLSLTSISSIRCRRGGGGGVRGTKDNQ